MFRQPYLYSTYVSSVRDPDPHHCWKQDPDPHQSKKFKSCGGAKWRLEEPWTLSMKAWRPRGPVGRPVIADCRTGITLMWCQFCNLMWCEKSDPNPHQSEKSDPAPLQGDADPEPCMFEGSICYSACTLLMGYNDVIFLPDILISIFISTFVTFRESGSSPVKTESPHLKTEYELHKSKERTSSLSSGAAHTSPTAQLKGSRTAEKTSSGRYGTGYFILILILSYLLKSRIVIIYLLYWLI